MSKKPSYYAENIKKLNALIAELDLGSEFKDPDHNQVRIYGATHVIDIWPARMVYHRVKGESVKSVENYHHLLDQQFNYEQVKKLLETGEV